MANPQKIRLNLKDEPSISILDWVTGIMVKSSHGEIFISPNFQILKFHQVFEISTQFFTCWFMGFLDGRLFVQTKFCIIKIVDKNLLPIPNLFTKCSLTKLNTSYLTLCAIKTGSTLEVRLYLSKENSKHMIIFTI